MEAVYKTYIVRGLKKSFFFSSPERLPMLFPPPSVGGRFIYQERWIYAKSYEKFFEQDVGKNTEALLVLKNVLTAEQLPF